MANTITQWRPQVRINLRNFKSESFQYPTYKELKRNLIKHLNESYDDEVSVSRSRRGEWGEWFENWGFNAEGKPVIIKQGWM